MFAIRGLLFILSYQAIQVHYSVATNLGLEWIVDEGLQKCCGDHFHRDCLQIATITRAQDSHHYIFTENNVIRSRLRKDGFPEIRRDSTWNESDWFGTVSKDEKTIAAFLYDGVIQIKKGDKYYRFTKPVISMNGGTGYGSRSGDCNTVHPLFCEDHIGELVDVTVSSVRGGRQFDEVKAYYKQYQDGKAMFYEKNYIGTSPKKGRQPTPFASISSVTTFLEDRLVHANREIDYGFIFDENGFACKYDIFKYEDSVTSYEGLRNPTISCFPTQVFMGCPQSWCFRADVDDILITSEPIEGDVSLKRLVTYRGHYFFDNDVKVPVPVPAAVDMELLEEFRPVSWKRHPYIDAGFEIEFGSNAFTALVKDTDIVFYDDATGVGVTKKIYDVFPGLWSELIGSDNHGTIDATLFSERQKELILFIGSRYATYSYQPRREYDGSSLQFARARAGMIAQDFPGLPADLDGAIVVDDTVYIFKENWVYQQREEYFLLPQFKYIPELSFYDPKTQTGFFQVDNLCERTEEEWVVIKRDLGTPPPLIKAAIIRQNLPRLVYLPLISMSIFGFFIWMTCILSFNKRESAFGESQNFYAFNSKRFAKNQGKIVKKKKSWAHIIGKGFKRRWQRIKRKKQKLDNSSKLIDEYEYSV